MSSQRGGGPGGASITRHFPFAFNTPGLAAGNAVPLYVPTPGDIIHDAWIEVDTAWVPVGGLVAAKADIGTFVGSATGWLAVATLIDMTHADSAVGAGWLANESAGGGTGSLITGAAAFGSTRLGVPGRFTAANPVCVCVSQTGAVGGGANGSAVGAAVLYLVTSTPI